MLQAKTDVAVGSAIEKELWRSPPKYFYQWVGVVPVVEVVTVSAPSGRFVSAPRASPSRALVAPVGVPGPVPQGLVRLLAHRRRARA